MNERFPALSASLALAVAAAALSACTTSMVASLPAGEALPQAAQERGAQSYGQYALGRSTFIVRQSAPEAPPKADPAIAPVSISNSVTVAPDGKTPEKPGEAAAKETKPLDSTSAWCAQRRKDYNAQRLAHLDFVTTHASTKRQIDHWRVGGLTKEEARTAAATLTAFKEARSAGQTAFFKADALLEQVRSDCPAAISVSIEELVEPDPDRTYRLWLSKHDLSEDTLKLETDGRGFFKSIAATATDRSVDALTSAVKSLALFNVNFAPVSAVTIGASQPPPPPPPPVQGKDLAELIDEFVAAPDEARLVLVEAALGVPGALPTIEPKLPAVRRLTLTDLEGAVPLANDMELRANCSDRRGSARGDTPSPGRAPEATLALGVVVSSARACEIVVRRVGSAAARVNFPSDGEGWAPRGRELPGISSAGDHSYQHRVTAWALDSTRPVVLPIHRTTFIKRGVTYTFDGGRLTSVDYSRPSPIVGIAALPATLIGAWTSEIATGLQGRKGVVEAETAYVAARTAQLQAQAALLAERNKATVSAPEVGSELEQEPEEPPSSP